MHITKVRFHGSSANEAEWSYLKNDLNNALHAGGFDYCLDDKPLRYLNVRNVRLSKSWTSAHGRNRSPYTGRRGNILGWNDWVRFNNIVNSVLDKHHASANVFSLGGKFKVRKGTQAMGESDWEDLAEENVGSMMEPVTRREAWKNENE